MPLCYLEAKRCKRGRDIHMHENTAPMDGAATRRRRSIGRRRVGVGILLLGIALAVSLAATHPAAAALPHAAQRTRPAAGGPGGGDIPDSAIYLRYTGRGFSIEYVEGWLRTTAAHGVL